MVDELWVPWLDSWIYFGNCNAPSTVSICGLCQRTCKNFVIIYYFKVPRFNYTYLCIYAKLVYIVDKITITFTYIYILYTVQFKLTNYPCHDFSYQCCKSTWCITNKIKALHLLVCNLLIFFIQLSLFQLEQPFS